MPIIDEIEIAKWKKRLEDPDYVKRLEGFQQVIYGIFEAHRYRTEERLIRFVYPRSGVKSIKSVVDKIRRNRGKQKEGEEPYDFEDIRDLVGIKVLCPYRSSAYEVMKWMFNQSNHFTVKPTSIKEAWTYYEKQGYRGWHFIVEPTVSSYPRLIGTKCEIQVKTMLQEAWDAQTHDISYKKEELIDKDLLDHIKYQSDTLDAIDKQSEIIRQLIDEVEEEEREHKIASAAAYLSKSRELLGYCRDKYHIELQLHDLEDCPLSTDILKKVDDALGHYHREKGVDRDLIRFATLIALCQRDAEREEMAISLAQDFINDNPEDPEAEDATAGVYWALNRFDGAIRHGKKAIDKEGLNGHHSPTQHEVNFCYWVADAVRARKDVDEELKKYILSLCEKFSREDSNKTGHLDTVAFVKIVLGTTIEEIENGLKLLREALKLGEQSNDPVMPIFYKRHERLAYLKIAELVK